MSELRYTVERSRNRHSRAVLKGDTVVIRLARGLPQYLEQKHIEDLLRRMAKSHAKQAKKKAIDPFRILIDGAPTLDFEPVTGGVVRFSVSDGTKTRAKKTSDGWAITRSPLTDDQQFDRFLWRLLSTSALEDVTRLVHDINERTLRVAIKNVTLKYMKSRWGSCSHRGTIALATPLLCTTPEILEYVIVHELAHVLHMNHSKRFWDVVLRWNPEYKQRVKELKQMRLT